MYSPAAHTVRDSYSIRQPNILVDNSGRAQLADFGLSSVTDPTILRWTSHSSAVSQGGSTRWQAPELFEPEGEDLIPNSKGSDIYAWACVCYEVTHSSALTPFSDMSIDIY